MPRQTGGGKPNGAVSLFAIRGDATLTGESNDPGPGWVK